MDRAECRHGKFRRPVHHCFNFIHRPVCLRPARRCRLHCNCCLCGSTVWFNSELIAYGDRQSGSSHSSAFRGPQSSRRSYSFTLSPRGRGRGVRALSSGLIVTARVTERFDLFSGEVVLPSEYIQDLVLYHHPCITNSGSSSVSSVANGSVLTTFPVTPSKEYTITELMLGKVGIEVNLRPEEAVSGTMVGSDGARLLDSDGNVLVVPQGRSTRPCRSRQRPWTLQRLRVLSELTSRCSALST